MTAISTINIQEFAHKHHITGLSEPSIRAIIEGGKDYSLEKADKFLDFQKRLNSELLQHSIITHNSYCQWFAKGEQTLKQLQAFMVQFSVFSNQFLVAQLQKVINADSLEGMRASKEILANEIGVVFNALHTQEELEELYFNREINETKFIQDGNEMLNGVMAFWVGLEQQRKRLKH